ncbi:hypothetical protein CYMTET_22795 [Cymbomonas tetramitiformis]|uniref:Uncharacterized protein n=1 Tax=Cymbomonas tetramitiformis TaxID=36881 RepID=A0AAE0L1K5_9CHLO|nr:hypothetical protein CYMTET_22795 [Cymbomonas tetramitiformis]
MATVHHACRFLLGCWIFYARLAEGAFRREDESDYLADYDAILAASYATSMPSAATSCVHAGQAPQELGEACVLSVNTTATSAQELCSGQCVCVVDEGVTLTMDQSLDVVALVVKGKLLWDDVSQTAAEQWLCAAYVTVENNGTMRVDVRSEEKRAYIYLKDNGVRHEALGHRALGGIHSSRSAPGLPLLEIAGRTLRRTWSLLAATVTSGVSSIRLMHDAADMGWRVGDRIAIAPTQMQSKGEAQWFYCMGINKNEIELAADAGLSIAGITDQKFLGEAHTRAEVINLSRNVVVTGDNFTLVACDPAGSSAVDCACDTNINKAHCTRGLHVIMASEGEHSISGTMRIRHTRVEKCGQRGTVGR